MDHQEERVQLFGATGEIGRDGLLTLEQRMLLNEIQKQAAEKACSYLSTMQSGDKYPLIAMATGIGKGNIIHRIIENEVRQNIDTKILLIAGTKNVLVNQTHEALGQYRFSSSNQEEAEYQDDEDLDILPDDEEQREVEIEKELLQEESSFLYRTGSLDNPNTNVHVATIQKIQSVIKRGKLRPEDYQLVIVDEVHNIGTRQRINAINKFDKVVGLTATPYRSSGTIRAPENYGFSIIESLTLPEAQELRLLPPLVGVQIDTSNVIDKIPVKRDGTIDYKKLERTLKESPQRLPFIAERIAPIITPADKKYKTVIAVNFVWEAQELAKQLYKKGVSVGIAVNQQAASEIDSDEIPSLDAIRRYQLPHEDEESVQVLISPYVAGEGFDAPATEVLAWASPTDSSLRYTQYTGRLARRAEGKSFGVIVDCLYQTDQYNWSYNLGMWMKGDIKQLENGMLWLGPETDIGKLKDIPTIQRLQEQVETKPLSELQKEGVLPSGDEELAITGPKLSTIFVGKPEKLSEIGNSIFREWQQTNPEAIAYRAIGVHTKPVVLDQEGFIQEMRKRGVQLRNSELQEVQENDLAITDAEVRSLFRGRPEKLVPAAREIARQLKETEPGIVTTRRHNNKVVSVVTDKDRFIREMQSAGFELKDAEVMPLQETDLAITQSGIRSIFSGDYNRLSPIAQAVIEDLRKTDPNLVVHRMKNTQKITAITDRDRFVQEMIKRGVNLKVKA